MNISRALLAAASVLATFSACSESGTDNQMPAPANEAISADNGSGLEKEASSSGGEAELQAPAPAAAGGMSEPASKAEPDEAAPASAPKTETPRSAPKAAPKAAAKVEAKPASEAEAKAPTPACAPEHRAMGHC